MNLWIRNGCDGNELSCLKSLDHNKENEKKGNNCLTEAKKYGYRPSPAMCVCVCVCVCVIEEA